VGKTTTGRALAGILGAEFADLDTVVTARLKKTPRELFREGAAGIAAFRKAEAEALAGALNAAAAGVFAAPGRPLVIAAGGGIIDNPDAVETLRKARALLVYLEIPAETAWARIAATGDLPPFLKTGNPRETHRRLHVRRAAAYRALAEVVVNAAGRAPETIAASLAIRACGPQPDQPLTDTAAETP